MAGWTWQAALAQDRPDTRSLFEPDPSQRAPSLRPRGARRREVLPSGEPTWGTVSWGCRGSGCVGAPGRLQSRAGGGKARRQRGRRWGSAGNAENRPLRVSGMASLSSPSARLRWLCLSALSGREARGGWSPSAHPVTSQHVAALCPAVFADDTRSSHYLLGCLRNREAGTG